MALSANKSREYAPTTPDAQVRHPVAASGYVYQGSMVGLVAGSGYARALTAGDYFAGFAQEEVDNASGSAGDQEVQVLEHGVVWFAAITGASGLADVSKEVFASDDATLTLTAGSNSSVGRISAYDATRGFAVRFGAASTRLT